MKQIDLIPGKHMTFATLSTHSATGARAAADSTPTVILFVDDGSAAAFSGLTVTITVTDRGAAVNAAYAGNYAAQIDVDDLLSSYDGPESYTVWGFWLYTIGGVARSSPIDPFKLVPPTPAAIVFADGGNTATAFKAAVMGDFAWAGGSTAFAVDDGPENMLATFTTGALAGQTRRVVSYNASTNVLTVDAPFTGTPADTDRLMFSNF